MTITPEELSLYERQMRLPKFGLKGQEKLKQSSVLLVGLGGLGSPAALYLAAAGVGRLGLLDEDQVDRSNLHRQILFSMDDIGQKKPESAASILKKHNPYIQLEVQNTRLSRSNARETIRAYDIVLDCSDNFSTRYLTNDACVLEKKALVSAAITNYEGQISVFREGGPCYRCLYSEPPPPEMAPSCAEAGVLGVLPGLLGTLQATEAIKIILGMGNILAGRMIHVNAMTMNFTSFEFAKDPQCLLCSKGAEAFEIGEISSPACRLSSEDLKESPLCADKISAQELQIILKTDSESRYLIDIRSAEERELDFIESSLHVPIELLSSEAAFFDKDAEIIVYCQSGMRGKRALQILKEKGFHNVKNLTGGILDWRHLHQNRVPEVENV